MFFFQKNLEQTTINIFHKIRATRWPDLAATSLLLLLLLLISLFILIDTFLCFFLIFLFIFQFTPFSVIFFYLF